VRRKIIKKDNAPQKTKRPRNPREAHGKEKKIRRKPKIKNKNKNKKAAPREK
jgi:hypothetical protein